MLENGLETHPSQGPVKAVQGGRAVLLTTAQGAHATVATRGLAPGHAHTLWWVVINQPSACESSPCKPPDVLKRAHLTRADVVYGDGVVAGADGTARFASHLASGPLPQGWFRNGFTNARGAEIHLVINDHGPLLSGLEHSMLSSYRGGCTDASLRPQFPASAKMDGIAGPNACRLVQTATFVQKEAR